jgi:hypothetical protein
MVDDGNCQFRALSFELYGDQSHHASVRSITIAHMKANPDNFMPYVGEESDWMEYLRKM